MGFIGFTLHLSSLWHSYFVRSWTSNRSILCNPMYVDHLSVDYWLIIYTRFLFIRLTVLTVLCCHRAPAPCRETVQALCRPVCSPLRPPAGCHCAAPSDTWPVAEVQGETLIAAPDLPWIIPAIDSTRKDWQQTGWEQQYFFPVTKHSVCFHSVKWHCATKVYRAG